MSKIVCRWCQNEIWLEPEETLDVCPVCENELGDYRTLQITLDLDPEAEGAYEADTGTDAGTATGPDGRTTGDVKGRSPGEANSESSSPDRPDGANQTADKPGQAKRQEADDEPRPDEDLRIIGGEEMLRFRSVVDKLLETQLMVPECPSCREYMIESGTLEIGPERFHPYTPPQVGQPVLEAPFAATVYLCPSCFTVHFMLTEKDREAVIRRSIANDESGNDESDNDESENNESGEGSEV